MYEFYLRNSIKLQLETLSEYCGKLEKIHSARHLYNCQCQQCVTNRDIIFVISLQIAQKSDSLNTALNVRNFFELVFS